MNAVSVVIVWMGTIVLDRLIFPSIAFRWHPEAVAHAVGILSRIIPSFFMHRAFNLAGVSERLESGQ